MLKKKIQTGAVLIDKGMTLLTQATDAIQAGADLNVSEMAQNEAVIMDLQSRNTQLDAENAKALKVVANFKKNILGE